MASPWQHAFFELEDTICDLPRMLNVLRCVHECGDLFGEVEAKEAMTFALDQSYQRVLKFTETYKRLCEEAMPPGRETALPRGRAGRVGNRLIAYGADDLKGPAPSRLSVGDGLYHPNPYRAPALE